VQIVRPDGCPDHIVCEHFGLIDEIYSMNIGSCDHELATLAPGRLLSSKVFGLLREHLQDGLSFILDPIFSELIHSDRLRNDGITEFAYAIRLLNRSFSKCVVEPLKILCIVNHENIGAHWNLLVFDALDLSSTWYDSSASVLSIDHDLIDLRLRNAISKAASTVKWGRWSDLIQFGTSRLLPNCPQQDNDFDCGVYVCMFVWYLVRNRGVLIPYLPGHMAWFRKLVFVELVMKMCFPLFPRL
jgi:hypothetical protein